MSKVQPNHETRQYWDQEAAAFDDEPDHGLHDPVVRDAWRGLLEEWLPFPQANVLDIGCGTGSLSYVLAGLGHFVTGIDQSPAMISQAERKAAAAGHKINFHVMEASDPKLSGQRFDGILCRHLLWSLPNLVDTLERWVKILKPGGRLLFVEGYWHTGGGLHSEEIIEALPGSLKNITIQNMSDQPEFWGRNVDDERYAIMAEMGELRLGIHPS